MLQNKESLKRLSIIEEKSAFDQPPVTVLKKPKIYLPESQKTLETHLKSVIEKINESENLLEDEDAPDLGIWDPRFNIEREKRKLPRARSTLKQLAMLKMKGF
jgi:hypothetical protein